MFHAEARRRGEQQIHRSFAPYSRTLDLPKFSASPRLRVKKAGTQSAKREGSPVTQLSDESSDRFSDAEVAETLRTSLVIRLANEPLTRCSLASASESPPSASTSPARQPERQARGAVAKLTITAPRPLARHGRVQAPFTTRFPGGCMSDWLLNLPVPWMGVVILVAINAFSVLLYFAITALAVGERGRAFKAVSPGMLPPLAIIFALLVGFLAAQVWSDYDRANTAVNREASALRGVILLAAAFPGEPDAHLRDLVRRHIQDAVTQEWPAMARHNATLTLAPPRLSEALRFTLSLSPHGDGQVAAQREIVAALMTALDARRQRIVLSASSINWVKWTVLLVQAGLTLLVVGLVHSDNRAANRIIMTVFATGVAVAVVLIASHSRPFSGDISVRPTVLLQVMPEATGSPPNAPP